MSVMSVMIGISAWREIHVQTVISLFNAIGKGVEEFDLRFQHNEPLLPRSRGRLLADFIRSQHDVLVFIDTDVVFSPEALQDSIREARARKAIVGCATSVRSGGAEQWASIRTLPGKPVDFGPDARITEIRYLGTSFMAIHQEVAETVASTEDLCLKTSDQPFWPVFDPMTIPHEKSRDLDYLQADYAFCERAQRSGQKVYLLPYHQLGHIGEYVYHVGATKGYANE